MPLERLARFILLPELTLLSHRAEGLGANIYEVAKERPKGEICPKCATFATSYYDKRTVTVKDEPIRSSNVTLVIHKHRWWCKTCEKPFTESVTGIMPRRKTTQRYRRSILAACEKFSDLTLVRSTYRCSSALIYKILYEQLELKWREYQYAWPKRIGIDEHFFRRFMGRSQFVTVFTDLVNCRLKEMCFGRNKEEISTQLGADPTRFNVEVCCIDLSQPYRNFIWNYFPNAEIVADKFHVLRLLNHHLLKELRAITGRNTSRFARKQLLSPSYKIDDYFERKALWEKLKTYPKLYELYFWKEYLHRFYRTKGRKRAEEALQAMIEKMRASNLEEVQTLAKTLTLWKEEVLNYFKHRLTNAMTEGFNNLAKLVQRRAFGYKSFRNYRLRVLNACA